jgi:subtilisin family serine protease
VVVAVIDTGVDYRHPDLKGNIWQNKGEIGSWAPANEEEAKQAPKWCKDKSCNKKDDDGNGLVDDFQGMDFADHTPAGEPLPPNNNPLDDNSHGSHVSGIIGATHDKIGTRGINAKVQIMAVKFLDREGSGTLEGAIDSIGYAIKMKADLINASWGGPGSSEILDMAIDAATEAGILFIAAAGNDTSDNDVADNFPANNPNCMSVVSTDGRDRISDFSNVGKTKTHIAAPGTSILSTVLFPKYEFYSGTSMATPHVTGAAAMIIATHPELKGHPAELRKHLMDTSDILVNLLPATASGGRLNLYNAVMGIKPAGHNRPEQANWSALVAKPFESEHPYKNGSRAEYVINQPGAKWIRVKFGRHSIEWGHDYISIADGSGNLYDVLTGLGLEYYSTPVQGDTVKLSLVTDKDVNGWGYEILGYEYMN